ncbi:MAG: monovalent cation/H(+) antiporter subunit G [Alphaproteobacteria bacterium]
MELAVDIVGGVLLAGGSIFLLIGGIGLLRMPDLYSRIHPAGITDTAGAGLILLGLLVFAGPTLVAVKLLLIFAIIFFTSPTSGHATARAALAAGLRPLLGRDMNKPADGGDKPSKP